MPKVYLAGPIANLTYVQGQDWRDCVYLALRCHGIKAYSPLRGKEWLDDGTPIDASKTRADSKPLATPRGIIGRDGYDVRTADVILANVDGVTSLSGGTAWEFGVAWALNKPVVMVAANEDNPYLNHPILSQVPIFTVPTLEEGIQLVRQIVLP